MKPPQNVFLDEIEELINRYLDEASKDVHLAELLRGYLRLRPDDWFRYAQLGMRLEKLYRIDEAIDACKTAFKLADEKYQWRIYSFLGNIYRDYRSTREAEKWFDLIAEENVHNFVDFNMGDIWIFKGAVLARLGQYEEALQCQQNAIDGHWKKVLKEEAWLNKGLVYRAQAKYDKAIYALSEALKINSEYSLAKTVLNKISGIDEIFNKCEKLDEILQAYEKRGETQEVVDEELEEFYSTIKDYYHQRYWAYVVELMDTYLKWRPDKAGLWRIFGEALMNVGRFQEALTVFEKVLELDGGSKEHKTLVYYFLGILHEEFSSREISETWYRKSMEESEKTYGNILNARGMNLLALGNTSMALELFENVIESEAPNNRKESAYYNQGLVYRSLGDYEKAVTFFKQALEINEQNKEAIKALEGLEGIHETLELCKKMKAIEI